MKQNSIFWKTSSNENTKKLLLYLNDNYLIVRLVERKNKRLKTIAQFDSGMSYTNKSGVLKQIEWIDLNPTNNMYQFYIIESV